MSGRGVLSSLAIALVAALLSTVNLSAAQAQNLADSFDVPPGFEVSRFADDTQCHDVYSMTLDARGHVVVSGPGYVKVLRDNDSDGRADHVTLFSAKPSGGAHGMVFVGGNLFLTADDALWKLSDANADDIADEPPEKLLNLKTPEHGANGLVHGPDGCLYLACGNDVDVTIFARQMRSLVKRPIAGTIVKLSAQGQPLGVVAHGFRNPYRIDFDSTGRLFTVDSDNERDYGLPTYEPTRLFDIEFGGHHGWEMPGWKTAWRRPAAWFDSVDRAAEIGRGSPTGLVVYRHRQFPDAYRDAVLSACWTMGKIYAMKPESVGGSCRAKVKTLLATKGTVGFAPCDLAVGPEGDLFIAIGGRGTQGGVFKLSYASKSPKNPIVEEAGDEFDELVQFPQPLTAWSRTRWIPKARQLQRKLAITEEIRSPDVDRRIRAIDMLVEVFNGGSPRDQSELTALPVMDQPNYEGSRLAWALAAIASTDTKPSDDILTALLRIADCSDPVARRAAWQVLTSFEPAQQLDSLPWGSAFVRGETRLAAVAFRAAQGPYRLSFEKYAAALPPTPRNLLSHYRRVSDEQLHGAKLSERIDQLLRLVLLSEEVADRLEGLRMVDLALGDIVLGAADSLSMPGYTAAASMEAAKLEDHERGRLVQRLLENENGAAFAEIARTAALLRVNSGAAQSAVAARLHEQSTAEAKIHLLGCLAMLPGELQADATAHVASAIASLHHDLRRQGMRASQNWPSQVEEVVRRLLKTSPPLGPALANDEQLTRADQAGLALLLDESLRPLAARRLLKTSSDIDDWEPPMVALLGMLPPEEHLPALRAAWANPLLQDSILPALAKRPRLEDRAVFVEALGSLSVKTVLLAAESLKTAPAANDPIELAAEVVALGRLERGELGGQAKQQGSARMDVDNLRATLLLLLRRECRPDEAVANSQLEKYDHWNAWYAKRFPAEANRLIASGAALDWDGWRARLKTLDFSAASAVRGKQVFARRQCQGCHATAGQFGPELTGAVKRMSREDLLAAIVNPSLQVSPAYQTTRVTTDSGAAYQGMVVYQSPEGVLLRTGADATLRIGAEERPKLSASRTSLMPTGLLHDIGDGELADLFAYLTTLGSR